MFRLRFDISTCGSLTCGNDQTEITVGIGAALTGAATKMAAENS